MSSYDASYFDPPALVIAVTLFELQTQQWSEHST